MEEETLASICTFHGGNDNDNTKKEEDDANVPLPGFRFHPTDEELVGFYLRRKVDNKKITLELIRSAEIYKHDPWDLPKLYDSIGDKEWYFYCKRGRKYKNSVRPNRVTRSGFWKATGVDKPVYSSSGDNNNNRCIIGLKKSLVYYRGNSGKGTKTDWMMHEFRLPPPSCNDNHSKPKNTMIDDARNSINNTHDQEAEVWTLCRVLRRNPTTPTQKKCVSDSRRTIIITDGSKTRGSIVPYEDDDDGHHMKYISFNSPATNGTMNHLEAKTLTDVDYGQYFPENSSSSSSPTTRYDTSFERDDRHLNDMLSRHGSDYDWKYLRSLAMSYEL